jgi:hypothetical protein
MQINRKTEPMVEKLIYEMRDCKTVLDLGCGQSSTLQYVPNIEFSTGVEVWQPYIDESKGHKIHSEYINMDVTKFTSPDKSYDAVMCVDVLEHIEKKKSVEFLKRMQKWAKKKVIIYVPNGFMPQGDPYEDGNEYQKHLSGWSPQDFYDLGFEVTGYAGYRGCRGEGADIKIKTPGILRNLYAGISYLSEPFCKTHPEYAFHLFAVYTVEE